VRIQEGGDVAYQSGEKKGKKEVTPRKHKRKGVAGFFEEDCENHVCRKKRMRCDLKVELQFM